VFGCIFSLDQFIFFRAIVDHPFLFPQYAGALNICLTGLEVIHALVLCCSPALI